MGQIIATSIVSLIVGLVIGVAYMSNKRSQEIKNDQDKAKMLLKETEIEVKNIIRQAELDGKTTAYELKLNAEQDIKSKSLQIEKLENALLRREDNIKFREETLTKDTKQLDLKLQKLEEKIASNEILEKEFKLKIDEQVQILEKIANLTEDEAKNAILSEVEAKMQIEKSVIIRDALDEANATAKQNATKIIANAILRYSNEEAIERTVSVVSLPSEEMKGRIIGREGRNIRAIEKATGVDLIIDDTPEVITVSCFNPIRREIARLSLESLIKDGRIQPQRIEEVVEKRTREINEIMDKAGEDAVFKLKIGKMDRELINLVGRLKYRYSYGQNNLEHSIEVARFAGMMAAELGLNQTLAKRAGLLHDIGKALDFEMDGTHVELGGKYAKKYGENETVINAIMSHHGDVPPTSIISYLVAAADTLSAARPGARYEEISNYISRLEELEKIGNSIEGVEKTYAIQAGREIRVIVQSDKIDDQKIHLVAHEIKERIENELTYPGHIKVNVIREVKASEVAK